jgi:predicted  nucleic acid-binding Zn-ribbon protein
MESSRDSSVWRNLAVTFGGGLALGAVGMKLTQTALRPADAVPWPEPNNTLADRLNSVEHRLEKMEHTPAPSRPAPASQPAAAPMDQKILEAVIGAVDARLHEHAGQMDRRLADLQALMAVMQGAQQQDRQGMEPIRQEAAALRTAVQQDMRQIRESVSRTVAGQNAAQGELQTLRQQHERIVDAAEQRFADMRQEYRAGIEELRNEMEQSIETRFVTAAAAQAAAQMEEQLSPLRAEVQQKELELAELRQRLAESEKSVLDVVQAIGEVCRQAADRMSSAPERRPAASAATPVPLPATPKLEARPKPEASAPLPTAPLPFTPAPPEPTAIAATAPTVETLPVPPAAADPSLAEALPDFLRDSSHRTNWRIPLVSSVLVSTGYLLLMHYLAAPLQ